jgi:DNA polymerase-3 subunit epsilon
MILDKNGKQTPKSHSLENVAKYFGFARESDTHNALEDAKLTARCLKAFFEMTGELQFKG